jgi:hypothetical protein
MCVAVVDILVVVDVLMMDAVLMVVAVLIFYIPSIAYGLIFNNLFGYPD